MIPTQDDTDLRIFFSTTLPADTKITKVVMLKPTMHLRWFERDINVQVPEGQQPVVAKQQVLQQLWRDERLPEHDEWRDVPIVKETKA